VENHINKFAPAVELGEFLIISQTVWSEVNEAGEFFDPKFMFAHTVNDTAALNRVDEALADGWIIAGEILGNNEKAVVMIRVSQ